MTPAQRLQGIRDRGTLAYAYQKGRPLLEKADFPYQPKWKPIADDWKGRIADQFWATSCKDPYRPGAFVPMATPGVAALYLKRLLNLRDLLLQAAGEEACLRCIEEDLDLIEQFGEFWMGRGIIRRAGRPSKCHQNSLYLWDANRETLAVATGYGLSADGMWRQHTWCVAPATARAGGRVVETTEKRILYYGVTLTPKETEEWIRKSS